MSTPAYILIVTAVLMVFCALFAIFAPAGTFGLNEFQIGQLGGRATGYVIGIGIVAWTIAKVAAIKKK